MDLPLATPAAGRSLARARLLARALDTAFRIPGTRISFGLDPVLGLVPGLGDLAGAALSGYIVLTGIRLGVPRSVALRLMANVALDTVLGTVPVVGDLFDAGWKSNARNVALIERHLAGPGETRRSSRLMVAAAALLLVLLAAGGVAVTVYSVRALMHLAR